jgi:hypothetical protein
MKRLPQGSYRYHEDRLVVRWRLPDGKFVSQGKRVARNCPLTAEERKAYVKYGIAKAVGMVRNRLGFSLRDAWDLVCKAREYSEVG